MIISAIVAMDKNHAIGSKGGLPWHLSDDFKNYKKITTGHALVMGRKTFESMKRPLPNRINIIVTRNKDYEIPKECYLVSSVEEGIELARSLGETECFINGGGEIYKNSFHLLTRLHMTYVDCKLIEADTFFPAIDYSKWERVESFSHPKDERNDYAWEYVLFEKRV